MTKAKLLLILFLLASPVLIAWQTQIGGGSGGGLPAGLTFASPTFTVSSAGNGNGCVALSGNTSGTATLCAFSTAANGIVMSVPFLAHTDSVNAPSYSNGNAGNEGLYFPSTTSVGISTSATQIANFTTTSGVQGLLYSTITKCAANGTAASPSIVTCSAAPAGVFSCGVGGETVCTVNTTAMVNANSTVIVTQDSATTTGTLLGSITCNTTLNPPEITAKVAATSFSITITAPAVNPACYDYWIVN